MINIWMDVRQSQQHKLDLILKDYASKIIYKNALMSDFVKKSYWVTVYVNLCAPVCIVL
jgi:hypothetical protein